MVLESWVAERSLATTQVLDCWKPIIFHSSYHEHSFTIHKLKPTYLKINKKEAWNAQLETLYINCTLQQPVSIMLRHFKHSSSSFRTLGLKIATGQWQFSFSFQNGNVSFSDVSTFSPPKFFFLRKWTICLQTVQTLPKLFSFFPRRVGRCLDAEDPNR